MLKLSSFSLRRFWLLGLLLVLSLASAGVAVP